MNDKEKYERLAEHRYKKSYEELNDTQKFVLELDFDRANYGG